MSKRVLCVGMGDLGSQVVDALLRLPGNHQFLIGGRNVEALRVRCNVSQFAALQWGLTPRVTCTALDLWNVEQTSEIITRFRPDLIFCAATLQPWMSIATLPAPLFDQLYPAMPGPWLPWLLALVSRLMQAVRATGLPIMVVNASYPDVVHAVLRPVGLAPTIGIGNLANNIPALRMASASTLQVPVERVEVRFVAEHYVSHHISRVGHAAGAPFHLTVLVDGMDQRHLIESQHLFALLPTTFKRSGKGAGQLITAASAAVIVDGLLNETPRQTHAPGPNGLPGGYPVEVSQYGVKLLLPEHLSLDQAIHLNEGAMVCDGIERIDAQGTVFFTEQNMARLKTALGYECHSMPFSEVDAWAHELQAKYEEGKGGRCSAQRKDER